MSTKQYPWLEPIIPTPAPVMPPGVGVGGAKGNQTSAYALADHTHATSVQRNRQDVTLAASTGRQWVTFPTPYAVGTIPTVQVTAETPDVTTYYYDARILAGSITNIGFTLVVNKVNQSIITGVLGAALSIFAPATGTTTIHYSAAKQTG